MNPIEYPFWVWATFFVVVFIALFVDIGIVNRKAHAPKRKEVITWSIIWISLALLFNIFVWYQFGSFKAREFFTGYLIELSLSVDNLFVFLLIFSYFKVPATYQHRVLFWGIFTALVLRMIMIFIGAELVERFHWIIYVFGAFLLYTGIKMLGEDEEFHPEKSLLVSFVTRFIRISKHYEGDKFFVIKDGKRTGTLLLLVLIVIEAVDVVFAVDSIPAIFGITTDRFIVYTSNVFAILGLRTFFFLLKDLADKFHFLKYGLAFILSFIGVKMLLPLFAGIVQKVIPDNDFINRYVNHEYHQTVTNISLVVVILALTTSVILSLIYPKHEEKAEKNEEISEPSQ
jgi:tellurite resistance protein TerC